MSSKPQSQGCLKGQRLQHGRSGGLEARRSDRSRSGYQPLTYLSQNHWKHFSIETTCQYICISKESWWRGEMGRWGDKKEAIYSQKVFITGSLTGLWNFPWGTFNILLLTSPGCFLHLLKAQGLGHTASKSTKELLTNTGFTFCHGHWILQNFSP